jgi:very-short-patch-repair endonuclease
MTAMNDLERLKLLIARAKSLRQTMTEVEHMLWAKLRRNQLGVHFRRQHPIGSYIADFACLNPKLIVEVDGGQHVEQEEYDERRTENLRALGFDLLRFWNFEVVDDVESVVESVEQRILQLKSMSGR